VRPRQAVSDDFAAQYAMSPQELFETKSAKELRILGERAFHGSGTSQDVRAATVMWTVAIKKGDLESYYNMAHCMNKGLGICKEVYGGPAPKEAEKVYESIVRMADHGYSMFGLANILFDRHKDSKDPVGRAKLRTALDYYVRAAGKGVAPAAYNVYNMYAYGHGVDADDTEALKWLRLAAKRGDPIAQVHLARRLQRGEGVSADPKRSFHLLEKAARSGRPVALHNVGMCYLEGEGAEKNETVARGYLEEAARHDFVPSLLSLSYMLEVGLGGAPDMDRALALLERASALGYGGELEDRIKQVKDRIAEVENGTMVPKDMAPPSTAESKLNSEAVDATAPEPSERDGTGTGVEQTYVWNSRPMGSPGAGQTLQIELEMTGDTSEAAASIIHEAQALPPRTPPAEIFLFVAKRAEETGVKLQNAALLEEAVENYAAMGHLFSEEQRSQLSALRA